MIPHRRPFAGPVASRRVVAAAGVVLILTARLAAAADTTTCDARRIAGAGDAARALAACHARAEKRGSTVDGTCAARALDRLRPGRRFAKLEARAVCDAAPDRAALAQALQRFTGWLAGALDPGAGATPPSRCVAARTHCAARLAPALAVCRATAVRRGGDAAACVQAAHRRFGDGARGCFAAAGRRGACPPGAEADAIAAGANELVGFLARLVAGDAGALVRAELLDTTDAMMAWIGEIFAQGIRRPGYAADEWATAWARDRFVDAGLEDVRLEPISVERWEPTGWSLEVWHEATPADVLAIPAYPIPFTAPTAGTEGPLRFTDGPQPLAGGLAVYESALLALPQSVVRDLWGRWVHAPDEDFDALTQIVPFDLGFREAFARSHEAGALGFVGILDFPWETDRYYFPYDAVIQPIPGVWVSAANGATLRAFARAAPSRGRLVLARDLRTVRSHNVVGTLRGASDEWIVIGSHHDGPWASAVEDGSGIALVLAQARYWARVPEWERPHNLLFLLNGGHMSGGAGLIDFTTTHRDFVTHDVVVELHLEHTAREMRGEKGVLVPTGKPEIRWWFTSPIPALEANVVAAICAEHLGRSVMMPVEGFPPGSANPPTDGAFFHPYAPVVHFLTAPMYLFAEADTLDKVDVESLEPVSRAAIRLVHGTRGQTAAGLRAATYAPPGTPPPPGCPPT